MRNALLRPGLAAALLLAAACSPQTAAQQGWTAEDVVAIARTPFFEGIPYDVVMELPRDIAQPALIRLLRDPSEQAAWPNAAGMLGIVGDENAAGELIDFIERGDAAGLGSEAARAKSDAVIGLGYLLGRTGSGRALEFLSTGVDPGAWQRRVNWRSEFYATTEARNRQFADLSILALGVSGRPEALPFLDRAAAAAPAARKEVAAEALRAHAQVSSGGLLRYYRLEARPNLKLIQPGLSRAQARPQGEPAVPIEPEKRKGTMVPVPGKGERLRTPGRSEVLRPLQPGTVVPREEVIRRQ